MYVDVLRIRLALGSTWKSSLRQGGFGQGITPTLLGKNCMYLCMYVCMYLFVML